MLDSLSAEQWKSMHPCTPPYSPLTIKMRLRLEQEVELRPVGPRARIGHGQEPALIMMELEVLILVMKHV